MNHSFNVEVAGEVGVLAATVFNSIGFWVETNRANGTNYHDGEHWTYNSAKAWAELFPYASTGQVTRALEKLREYGYVATGNYNQNPYDRTLWYSLTEKGKAAFYGENAIGETDNSIYQKREMEKPKTPNDINSTDTNQLVNPDYMSRKPKRKKFEPPTLSEVTAYCEQKGYHFDPSSFFDYYEASGWRKANGKKVASWKQCCVTWESRAAKNGSGVTWDAELAEYADALSF